MIPFCHIAIKSLSIKSLFQSTIRAPCQPERSLLLKLPLSLQIAFLSSGRVNPKQIKPNPQRYLQPLTVLLTSVTIQRCVRKRPKLSDLKQQSLVLMGLSLSLVD